MQPKHRIPCLQAVTLAQEKILPGSGGADRKEIDKNLIHMSRPYTETGTGFIGKKQMIPADGSIGNENVTGTYGTQDPFPRYENGLPFRKIFVSGYHHEFTHRIG